MADVTNLSYMKTKVGRDTYLWKFLSLSPETGVTFQLIKPLGNNGEYLEISPSSIDRPLNETVNTSKDNESSEESSADIKTSSPQESTAEESAPTRVITPTEEVKNLSAIADLIMLQNPKLDHPAAEKLAENIKGHERSYRKFLQNVFKHKGLNLNEEDAIKEFKKYC